MKRFLILLLFLLAATSYASTNLVIVDADTFKLAGAMSNRTFYITPRNTTSVGNTWLTEDKEKFTFETNGVRTITNLPPNEYTIEVVGPYKTTTKTFVVPDTNATLYIKDLIATLPNTLSSNMVYTKVQSDARYSTQTQLNNTNAALLTAIDVQGADSTNYTVAQVLAQGTANTNHATAAVLSQGAANTNHAVSVLQASTNYADAKALAQGTSNTNHATAIWQSNSNYTDAKVLAQGEASTNHTLSVLGNKMDTTNSIAMGASGVAQTVIGSPDTNAVAIFKNNTGGTALLVHSNGSVGVGKVPTAALDVQGAITVSGSVNSSSDVRAGANNIFYHTSRNRWYSLADGTMTWTKNDGTTVLLAVTNGALTVPSNATVGGVGEFLQVASGGTPTANSARLYAKDNAGTAELYALDEAGNEALQTPHPEDAPAAMYGEGDAYQSEILKNVNYYVGSIEWINITRMAKIVERIAANTNTLNMLGLTNWAKLPLARRQIYISENFTEYNTRVGSNVLTKLDWTTVQSQRQAAYDMARATLLEQYNAGDTNIVVPPVKDVRKPKPAWMQ